MSVVLFDTHAFVKRLTAAGMPEAQAEVLADEHARLIDERLATKTDVADLRTQISELRAEVKVEIEELRAEVKAEIATLPTRDQVKAEISEASREILKWFIGTAGFQTLVVLGAVIALVKAFH